MTTLRIIGVASLALAMLTPNVMAQRRRRGG